MELAKAYDPSQVEDRIYAFWEQRGYFKPEQQIYLKAGEPQFVITVPPPNVTGTLHMGHALTAATEDLMTRYHRMKGARTLWVPGTDHAGIATQAVVEKKLAREGKDRKQMGRSAFLEEVWEFKEFSHKTITMQSKKLGMSMDWGREAFTMDENLSLAVRTAFKHLYDKGLIYRDTRMVNWDPVQLTGVSDLEAVTEDEGEAGHLWTIRYPLQTNRWEGPIEDGAHEWGSGQWAEGATQFITIATTRPETLLGDTAIMVNPDDDRYKHLVGSRAILPVLGRWTPIISDEAVDTTFGTGAVKVTPAHDFTDYEVGKRHHLEFIEVLDESAKMNENAGPYAGLDRFEARKRIVADLQKEGLLVKVEDYRVRLARGERSGAVIEPRISLQWFCDMKDMAQMAGDAVRDGRIKIVPERFEKEWFRWLDNIRDWTISRQLWWGHQVPVWQVAGEKEKVRSQKEEGRKPSEYCALNEAEAYAAARKDWGEGVELVQNTDVLDTWFSSGLWPFSTLGWPGDTADMRNYYPNTMLETGYDILFFWVARMVMMGMELTGQPPFNTVYLHGLIRQADGKKMSKSRPEKAVDPVEMINTYGADALRFYLLTAGAPGNDIKVDVKIAPDGRKSVEQIEGARNFANKLWNAARFVIGKLEGASGSSGASSSQGSSSSEPDKPSNLTNLTNLPDQWIRARTEQVVADVRRLMDDYQYGEAGKLIYEFVWNDFCDWYVELSKLSLNAPLLIHTLDTALRLLHPFMPFVTEEIWQKLKETALQAGPNAAFDYPSLMLAPFPEAAPAASRQQPAALDQMAAVQAAIRAIRNIRAEYKVEPNKRVPALISAGAWAETFTGMSEGIRMLAKVDDSLQIAPQLQAPEQAVTQVLGDVTLYLPLAGLVDMAAEKTRLQNELAQIASQIEKSDKLLNSDFGKRAPAAVIEKEKAKQADLRSKQAQIQERLGTM